MYDVKTSCEDSPIIYKKDYSCSFGKRTLYFARRLDHGVTTKGFFTKKDAIEAWNKGHIFIFKEESNETND